MTNWFTAHLMHHTLGRASQHLPDGWQTNTLWFWLHNSLDSSAFRGAQAQWDRITLPLLSVGNWTGFGLHLRGNTEAFMRAASPHKKLRIHNGSHVHPFYTEEGKRDQLRFFDYWLKGIDNGVMDEPPVKLAIRKGGDAIEWRHEHEWPLARTQWTKLYFDLSAAVSGQEPRVGALVAAPPRQESACSYPASSLGTMGSTSAASSQVMGGGIKPGMGVALETPPLEHDLEITGPLAAVLYVSSETEDMDLFLTLRNFGPDGNEVLETGQQGAPVPVAKGWLRVSHRELDPALSLPYRPYHRHQRRLYLAPGEVVEVQVEIWPTSMTFRKGHRIRLDVQPRDGVGSAGYMHYHADYNTGMNTIHAGGDRQSHLLLPVIPFGRPAAR
jgi:putative CocE/NonD family hydrolase